MKINIAKYYFLLLIAIYYYAATALKNDYISPDAEYFLSASYLEVVDIKYAAWIFIINAVGADNIVALYVIGVMYLAYKISKIINNYLYLLFVILLPTVFYFSTVVLRDLLFLLAAQIMMIFLISQDRGYLLKISTLVAIVISLVLRPPYGFLLIIMFLMDRLSERMILRVIFFAVAAYCTFGFSLMISADAYDAYVEFIKGGHGKNLNTFGVLEIDDAQLNEMSAFLNYFTSFIYFWYIQANGTGALLDALGKFESIFYLVSSALIFFTLVTKQLGRYNKQIKICILMLVFSMFMASFTQSHDDSMRFRLIFIPSLIFLFVLSIEGVSKISLKFKGGILKIIRVRG